MEGKMKEKLQRNFGKKKKKKREQVFSFIFILGIL